jgi:serine/threonine protein kinase
MSFFSTLGLGSFGFVYRAAYDGYPVAIKQLELGSNEDRNAALREVEVHCTLNHHTVLRTFGACEHEQRIYLVLEYARFGSLKSVLREAPVSTHDTTAGGVNVTLRQRVAWLRDIIDAVEYLHQRKVIHRDIKCDNVMLREDMKVLLGDMGLARLLTKSRKAYSKGLGTGVFRAPEVEDKSANRSYTVSADVYSYGIIVVEILSSRVPGSRDHGLEDITKLWSSSAEDRFESNELFALDQLWRIVQHCTMLAPDQRPAASQVLQWLDKLWSEWNESGPRSIVPLAEAPLCASVPAPQMVRNASVSILQGDSVIFRQAESLPNAERRPCFEAFSPQSDPCFSLDAHPLQLVILYISLLSLHNPLARCPYMMWCCTDAKCAPMYITEIA